MSFALMRLIDHWVGRPLLAVLRLFTRQPRSLACDAAPRPRRVVCAKFIGLGSVVLSLPLLKALKQSGVEVWFWTFRGQAELVEKCGWVDQVHVIDPSPRGFLRSLLRGWVAIRRFRPDAFLDLEPTANFSALLSRLSGAPTRVGFISAKPHRESVYTHRVSLTPERHMVENHLLMARCIGFEGPLDTRLPEPPAALTGALTPRLGGPGDTQRAIVINVNASDLSWHRLWPDSHWRALCQDLLADPQLHGAELVFPGSNGERKRVKRVLGAFSDEPWARGRVHDLSGKTSLAELTALLARADLVVSVDSGIMHLAAWTGTPVVGLFGPETPNLYSPWSAHGRALSSSPPCSPCLSVAADKVTRCRDNQCMKRLTPAEVARACRSLMAQSRGAPRRKAAGA